MQLLSIPVYDCSNESDVEQKFIYPLLTHPSFLDIPNKAILTKRSLGTLSFIEKSDLPRNYVPDYVVFFSGVPTCVIEAKAPDVPVDLALQEARLYGQSMNSHFPSGTNPVRVVAGCNGRQLLVGNWDSVDHDKFSVQELVIGSKHLTRLREVMGSNRLIQHAKLIQRATPHRGFARPSQQMDPQLFRDRVQPNALAPYLTPLYEMFFRAEDPEKIQLIIERAYVDTAELRQYDEVLNAILRQIERVQETSYQTIQTDKKREYTLTPELTRYQNAIVSRGRMHLIIGSRGSGKTLFIARFFTHLIPDVLKTKAVWSIIDFNRAPANIENIENYICEAFIQNVENVGFDLFALDGLNRIFSVEINRLQRGALAVVADDAERRRLLATELVRLSSDRRTFALNLARHITGESSRPLIVAFDNVDRRVSSQQLEIFQAAQWFRNETRAFALLTLRDLTFERYKGEPPLDAFAQISNFYIRPPRFSLVLQKRLTLAIDEGLDELREIEQMTTRGMRFRYSKEHLKVFLQKVYEALFGGEQQVGRIIDALAERDVREALGMFARVLASGHFDADRVIGIGTGGSAAKIYDSLLVKISMRSDYCVYSSKAGFIHNLFWMPKEVHSGNIFLSPEILGFFAQSGGGADKMPGYWRLQELIADVASMGFGESEIREAAQNALRRKMIAFDGEDLEAPQDDDLIKITASGFIHLRILPHFIEYISSVTVHCFIGHSSVVRKIAELWSRVTRGQDLDFSHKHEVASVFADYLVREKARLDGQNPLSRERSREAENLVKVVTQAVNITQASAGRNRYRARPRPLSSV